MKTVFGILLLILAMVVAVTAYSSAQVNNPGTMAITNTTESLLSLQPCSDAGNRDGAIYIDTRGAGELMFDFRRGLAKYGNLGFQPNSRYTWDCAFEIHNRTNETLEVWIENSDFNNIDIDVGTLAFCAESEGCESGYQYFVQSGAAGNRATLESDQILPVSIRFEIDSGALAVTESGHLNIHATAQ